MERSEYGTPLFSIVIPTYNRSAQCSKAIQSVQRQHEQSWEILVVDDGSTDDTREMVFSLGDERVRYIRQENKGAAAARNNGIEQARGSYVCFLDSDDEYLPDHLSVLRQAITESLHTAGFLFTLSYWERGGVRQLPMEPWSSAGVPLMLGNVPDTSSICIEASLLARNRFDPRFKKHEDAELWTRIARMTPVLKVPKRTVVYGVHEGPRMTSGTLEHFKAMRQTYDYIERTQDQRSYIPARALRGKWTEIYLGFLECVCRESMQSFIRYAREAYPRTGLAIYGKRRFWRALLINMIYCCRLR